MIARALRSLADLLALWSDAAHRLAERIQPTVRPSSDYCELVEALQREALEDHNRQVARQLYRPGLRVVR